MEEAKTKQHLAEGFSRGVSVASRLEPFFLKNQVERAVTKKVGTHYCCLTFHCAKLQIHKDHQGPIPRTSKRTSKDKYARRRLDFSPFGGSTVIFIPFCNTLTGK